MVIRLQRLLVQAEYSPITVLVGTAQMEYTKQRTVGTNPRLYRAIAVRV